MNELKELIDKPELCSTKKLNKVNSIVKSALNQNSNESINLLCDYMFSKESSLVLQKFAISTNEILKSANLLQEFYEKAQVSLKNSFWESDVPNFSAAINSTFACGKDFFFENNRREIIKAFYNLMLYQNKIDEHILNKDDLWTSASKVFELYIDYFTEPEEIKQDEIFREKDDLFFQFTNKMTDYSLLSSYISKTTHSIQSFDSTFSFLRTLASMMIIFLPHETITSLYNDELNNSLSTILGQYFENYCKILLKCIIARKVKNNEFCEKSFSEILNEYNHQNPDFVIRIFLYTGINQILPFFSPKSLDIFLDFYGQCLLKDFDSSNSLVSLSIRRLLSTLLKNQAAITSSCTPEESEKYNVNLRLMKFIEPLSFNSKLKTWMFPQLLNNLDANLIPNSLLIEMIQDLSDSNFVKKCVKSVCKVGWKSLIDSCKEISLNSSITGNLTISRPILEVIFTTVGKESIDYAFRTLVNPDNKIIDTWLKFECLQSLPKSKWPISLEEIKKLIDFSIKSGNWDLRSTSFIIFTVSGFPRSESEIIKAKEENHDLKNDEDILFFENNFENLFFFDSPKFTQIIISSFIDFIERISSRGEKSLPREYLRRILVHSLRISCNHMLPSYMSSHRQFAFEISKAVFSHYSNIVFNEKELSKFIISIASLLYDTNAQLRHSSSVLLTELSGKSEKVLKILTGQNIQYNLDINNKLIDETDNVKQILNNVEGCDITGLNDGKNSKNWEYLCELFEKMDTIISRGNVDSNTIEIVSNKLFDILINTRVLAITCRGQAALESITSKLPKNLQDKHLESWTSSLLNQLDSFDMENMRRSAALPYLAISILRLNAPDIMKSRHSIFEKLVKSLTDVICRTENPQEATHSLNMIRAVLTDKTTSPLLEVVIPSTFSAIFKACESFPDCWDVITAANLCLSAIIRKIKKKNISQEDINNQSLLLNQFFNKISGSRDVIIKGLKCNSNTHLCYLSLVTLSSFSCGETTDSEIQELILKHIGCNNSRKRKLAARALISVISKDDYLNFFNTIAKNLSRKSWNEFHGQIIVLKELLLNFHENDQHFEFNVNIHFDKIPPFIIDDLLYVISRTNQNKEIQFGENGLILNNFYFDQISYYLYNRSRIETISLSGMVSLLWRISMFYNNKIDFPELTNHLVKMIFDDEIDNDALLFNGLIYLKQNPPPKSYLKQKEEQIAKLILKKKTQHTTASALISLLAYIEPNQKTIENLFDTFESIVFDLHEETTPAHISIAELLPSLLFDSRGLLLSLRLLIDDVPYVRTLSICALSQYFQTDLLSEIILFDKTIKICAQNNSQGLLHHMILWSKLIESKIGNDSHGEPLSVLVDEFFFVKKICQSLKIGNDLIQMLNEPHPENLLSFRKKVMPVITNSIESIIDHTS